MPPTAGVGSPTSVRHNPSSTNKLPFLSPSLLAFELFSWQPSSLSGLPLALQSEHWVSVRQTVVGVVK